MAWTTPPTFVSGAVLTAAQLNILATNLLETAPAKATSSGQIFVSTGVNTITARTPGSGFATVTESTTSTAFTDLTTFGPTVTATTGANALVFMNAYLSNTVNGATSSVGLDISGATTSPPSAIYLSLTTAQADQQVTCGASRMVIGLTSGSNVFTMKYVVGGGTGLFGRRSMSVIPL